MEKDKAKEQIKKIIAKIEERKKLLIILNNLLPLQTKTKVTKNILAKMKIEKIIKKVDKQKKELIFVLGLLSL